MTDVTKTLEERGSRYGAFIDHATICQGLIEVLHEAPNWWRLDPDMKQAMHVICDKMARCLNGDPSYTDNWHDIQGYARLVEVRLLKKEEEKKGQLFEPEPVPETVADEPEVEYEKRTNLGEKIPTLPFPPHLQPKRQKEEDAPCCGENRSSA